MIKKTFTFDDFNGDKVTQDWYFNLSKSELAELALSRQEGMEQYLKTLVGSKNGAEIIKAFKSILMLSVGKRSDDGSRFLKRPEFVEEFVDTGAYDVFFMELIENPTVAAEFIKGAVPSDMAEKIDKAQVPVTVEIPSNPKEGEVEFKMPMTPQTVEQVALATEAQIMRMSPQELRDYLLYQQRSL